MLDFLDFTLLDVLDIVLVAVLLYYAYKLLKGSVAISIFFGVALIIFIWQITQALQMKMLSGLLGALISLGAIALLIVFQPEVRKFLLLLGSTQFTNRKSFLRQWKFLSKEIKPITNVDEIIGACSVLSKSKMGALIVIERTQPLDFLISEENRIKASVNSSLLECLFFKNSPLHDGAIIIRKNTIIAARTVLPVSDKKIPSKFGLRHRAAVGVTERTDALCILVSEERGTIVYIKDGEFVPFKKQKELIQLISNDIV